MHKAPSSVRRIVFFACCRSATLRSSQVELDEDGFVVQIVSCLSYASCRAAGKELAADSHSSNSLRRAFFVAPVPA